MVDIQTALRTYRSVDKAAKVTRTQTELPYISRARLAWSGSPMFEGLLDFYVNAVEEPDANGLVEPELWKPLSAKEWKRRTTTPANKRGWTKKGLEAEIGPRLEEAGIDVHAPFVEGQIISETYTPRGPHSEDEKFTSDLLVRTKSVWLLIQSEAWIPY